jgi:beta-N-acetylhexosaminidase
VGDALASVGRDVGQLLWVGYDGVEPPAELVERVASGGIGAVILFARNLPRAGDAVDVAALVELIDRLHAAAPIESPLLVAIDQEGGRVQRVREPGTVWPPMLSFERIAAARDVALAEAVGRALGDELAALGIDIDFAPVLDVHTNAANPIIGDRAFAADPARAAARALAFARGLAEAGVLACGKHFPGHGDTSTDSHLELPRVDHPLERLRAVELAPFRRAAEAGIPMIMTAHVVFAALDAARPATLSPAVIRDLLRGELGYRGLVVSDDLDMKAIRDHFGSADAAVGAIAAGCDVLLLCRDPDAQREVADGLVRAARGDPALRARVAEAAAAVVRLKRDRPRVPPATVERARALLGCAAHRRLATELAGAA